MSYPLPTKGIFVGPKRGISGVFPLPKGAIFIVLDAKNGVFNVILHGKASFLVFKNTFCGSFENEPHYTNGIFLHYKKET